MAGLLRILLGNLPVFVFTCDKFGNLITMEGSLLKQLNMDNIKPGETNIYHDFQAFSREFDKAIKQNKSYFTHRSNVNGKTFILENHITRDIASGNIDGFVIDVTEREGISKNYESTLSSLKAVMEASEKLAIYTTDLNGRAEFLNPGAYKMLSYSVDDLKNKVSLAKWHDPSEVDDMIRKIFDSTGEIISKEEAILLEAKKNTSSEAEWNFIRKDGSKLPVREIISCRYDNNGELAGYLAIVTDLTEKKENSVIIEKQQKKLASVINSVRDIIITIDQYGIIDSANSAVRSILGYDPDEITGRNINILMAGKFQEGRDSFINNYIQTGQNNEIATVKELEAKHKNGSIIPVELTISEFKVDGRTMFTGIIRDISEKIEKERTLKINKFAMDNSSDGIFRIEKDSSISYVNKSAEIITGWESTELLGKSITDIDKKISKNEWPLFWEKLKNDAAMIIETKAEKKDSTLMPVEVSANYFNFGNEEFAIASLRNLERRKDFEIELREREEKYSSIFEMSPEAIVLFDEKGFIKDMNSRIYDFLGFPPEKYINRHISKVDFFTKATLKGVVDNFKRRIAGEVLTPYEAEFLDVKGNIRIGLIRASLMRDSDGRINSVIVMISDITERNKSVTALKESEEKFRLLAENLELVIWMRTKDKIIYVNPAYEKIWGSLRQELYNDPDSFSYKVHPDDIHILQDYFEGDNDSSLLYDYEFRIIRDEGAIRWIWARGFPVKDEDDTIREIGIAEDITDRKNIEQKIKKLNEHYEIINNISNSLINSDTDEIESKLEKCLISIGKHFRVDRAYIFEFEQNLAIMNNSYEWCAEGIKPQIENLRGIPSDYLPWWMDKLKASENIKVDDVELMPEEAAGEKDILQQQGIQSVLVVPMILKGALIGFLGFDSVKQKRSWQKDTVRTTRMMSEIIAGTIHRKRYERDLVAAIEIAEKATQAKSMFLANMSHEIRTPMNSIIGFTDLLRETVSNPKNKKYIEAINSAGKNLLNLIDDILDLSKIEAGKLVLNPEPVDIKNILNEIKEIFTLKVNQKGIDFRIITDDNIPPTLYLDETRVRQILLNLAGNAVKFTSEGFVTVTVHADNKTEAETDLIFEVSDTGIGIQDEQLEIIFEAFKQQDSQDSRKYGGTGLGLTITKRLIEMMNGSISVESTPGVGSAFMFKIPDVKILESLRGNQLTAAVGEKFLFQKILIVDDVELNRQLVKSYLEDHNLDLREAAGGVQAIEKLRSERFDLVILDLKMPEVSGYDVLAFMKANPGTAELPVIAMTASVLPSEREKAGIFSAFLSKPLKKQDLINELKKFLKTNKYIKKTGRERLKKKGGFCLRESISSKHIQRINELKDGYILSEIEEFAEEIRITGYENGVNELTELGSALKNAAGSFDIDSISQIFDYLEKNITK
ncbi:MAG: PAS domain S-box protein [Candidatus Kapaibacterium sp.]